MKNKPLVEFEAFKTSEEMQKVAAYVEQRLQLPDNYLNYGNVIMIVSYHKEMMLVPYYSDSS